MIVTGLRQNMSVLHRDACHAGGKNNTKEDFHFLRATGATCAVGIGQLVSRRYHGDR
ncbi:hypothetical protein [Komagataeibacter diospyri]|uniref:hypothetical protein n=1 Tax=Komagataeibacter diospyri TaxID=1932662 RepID=UPI0012B50BBE|nr:hypothetical protein [Komagataeibacter diospyri]